MDNHESGRMVKFGYVVFAEKGIAQKLMKGGHITFQGQKIEVKDMGGKNYWFQIFYQNNNFPAAFHPDKRSQFKNKNQTLWFLLLFVNLYYLVFFLHFDNFHFQMLIKI